MVSQGSPRREVPRVPRAPQAAQRARGASGAQQPRQTPQTGRSDQAGQGSQPRRPRHLMDPSAPRQVHTAADALRLTHVQRWVMSVLAVTTILHLAVGIAIAAVFLPTRMLSAEIGLNVIAMAFGVIAVASGLAIHQRPLASPWLLLGLVPGLVGLVVVLA